MSIFSGDITPASSHSSGKSMKDMKPKESPRFYKKDVTSILKERNELKEKVIELEEEIVALKREISRLSNFGTLTLNPNAAVPVRRTRADAFLDVSHSKQQPRSAAAAMLQKTLKSYTNARPHVSDVEVTGYKKRGRYYVYVIKLTWSDGQRYEIYRRYGEFFTFQHTLLQLFPEESGRGNSHIRIIPSLPTIDNVLSLFGRTNTESIMKTRLATISEYCQILLQHLDEQVSRSPHVLNFFRPTIGDTQLTKLQRKLSDADLSTLSVYPQDMPAGCLFEEYVVLADYEATTTGEISAKAGDRVKVLKKEDSGWWLVAKAEEIGYIASDYLKPCADQDIWKSMSSDDLQQYLGFACHESLGSAGASTTQQLKYVAVEDYHTEDLRQLCLKKDEMVLVVEMSEDGWWLVLCNKKQGWVPASYLQAVYECPKREAERSEQETHKEVVLSASSCGTERGEDYEALESYCGEHLEDISFPRGATVEVLEKNPIGWWVVRYKEKIGIAPASFLHMRCTVPDTESLSSMDSWQCISGILIPPPRSELFRHNSRRRISELSLSLHEPKSCNDELAAFVEKDDWDFVPETRRQ